MRTSSLFLALTLLSLSTLPVKAAESATETQETSATADDTASAADAADDSTDVSDAEDIASVKKQPTVIKGSMEFVVCTEDKVVAVRDDKLVKVSFKVPQYEVVKTFQGWGSNKKNARGSNFVKVQFPSLEGEKKPSIGWLPQSYIEPKSQCKGALAQDKKKDEAALKEEMRSSPTAVAAAQKAAEVKTPPPAATPAPTPAAVDATVAGLKDPNCCEFPLNAAPKNSITQKGMWNFGWRRNKGRRVHAACDLYQAKNADIVGVAPGVVVRDLYFFYQGTYALEVKHADGFVVRYGEVTGKKAKDISAGRRVAKGQLVGYVGKTRHPSPMLHFELYSGAKKGSLSGHDKYQRRSDLMNPTDYLLKWQENKFRDRK